MNDLKERWVKALRSGRYRQTTGRLSRFNEGREENCCLGVLCRVARVRTDDWRDNLSLNFWQEGEQLRDAVGLDAKTHDRMTALNDAGTFFPEIADYIEENL